MPDSDRYARQLNLPGFGPEGQARLAAASVLVVGAGGLGASALPFLAAAGVGRLTIVDPDVVELSNLHRQVLYRTEDLGQPKAHRAAAHLRALNPEIHVQSHATRFTTANAATFLDGHDILLDGTDNFPTRYLCNDAAVLARKPNVYAAVLRYEGQLSVFAPHTGGPCYRCLFPSPPAPGTVPTWSDGGVLGVLPGIMGTLQALEAIKWLAGLGTSASGRLLHYDLLTLKSREIRLRRDPACVLCGEAPSLTRLLPIESPIGEISAAALAALRSSEGRYLLIDVREPEEVAIRRFPESWTIPLGEIGHRAEEIRHRLAELPPGAPWIIHCHSGGRSARAVRTLTELGLPGGLTLVGGLSGVCVRSVPE
jgi:sulfur-carrier protein adenylyltransferase/sulfurtransferase